MDLPPNTPTGRTPDTPAVFCVCVQNTLLAYARTFSRQYKKVSFRPLYTNQKIFFSRQCKKSLFRPLNTNRKIFFSQQYKKALFQSLYTNRRIFFSLQYKKTLFRPLYINRKVFLSRQYKLALFFFLLFFSVISTFIYKSENLI